MGENHSIRLRLVCRRGQQIDLRCEKITEADCRLSVDPDPGCDDNVILDWTIECGSEATGAKGEIDHAVNCATATEDIRENDRDVVGIGNQTGLHRYSDRFLAQLNSPQVNYLTASEIMRLEADGVQP